MPDSKPPPRQGVYDHHCITAEDFLDALSPRHELWVENPRSWIYRGQADAEWELRAKAVRDPGAFAGYGVRLESTGASPGEATWSARVGLQKRLLARFRDGLDQSGLPIPTSSPRIDYDEYNLISSSAEPERETFPLMALAQHHGLPTLLLDWTRRAWVAAYFAAADAAAGVTASNLAVWALPSTGLRRNARGPYLYEAPGGTNPNLRAQSGMFVTHVTEDNPSLKQHFARLSTGASSEPQLRRISLPTSRAPTLLRLLSYEGISGASMFPGPDEVVKSMREETLWDRPVVVAGRA